LFLHAYKNIDSRIETAGLLQNIYNDGDSLMQKNIKVKMAKIPNKMEKASLEV
jgi:hypothetical protein